MLSLHWLLPAVQAKQDNMAHAGLTKHQSMGTDCSSLASADGALKQFKDQHSYTTPTLCAKYLHDNVSSIMPDAI